MPLTPEEIAELTADPSPLNPLPTVGTEQLGPAGKFFDPFKPAPLLERLGAAAPMALSGFGAPSFLGKLGVAEKVAPFLERRLLDLGIGAAPEASRGNVEGAVKEGGLTAAAGAGVDVLGKPLRYLTSGLPGIGSAARWGKETIGELEAWAKKNVPSWSDVKNLAGQPVTGEKAVYAMTKGEGVPKLHKAYDEALMAAKDAIPAGTMVPFPEDFAKVLKLKLSGGVSPKVAELLQAAGREVPPAGVDARALIEKLPGTEGEIRSAIRATLGDYVPPKMLQEYKAGMGLIDWAGRGGVKGPLAAERYNPAAGTAALERSGARDFLMRDLGEAANIIRGPGREPITQQTPPRLPWEAGKALGALATAGAGVYGGHPFLGPAAGVLMEAIPRPSFYRHVPPTLPPLGQQGMRAVMPGFLQNMRSSEEER